MAYTWVKLFFCIICELYKHQSCHQDYKCLPIHFFLANIWYLYMKYIPNYKVRLLIYIHNIYFAVKVEVLLSTEPHQVCPFLSTMYYVPVNNVCGFCIHSWKYTYIRTTANTQTMPPQKNNQKTMHLNTDKIWYYCYYSMFLFTLNAEMITCKYFK